MMKPSLLLFLSASVLSACSLSPIYQRPEVVAGQSLPSHFKESIWIDTAERPAAPLPSWWQVFKDDTLNTLIEKVGDSPSLAQSHAQWSLALANARGANAERLPAINLSANNSQAKTASTTISRSAQASLGIANWEIDLWNRLGDGIAVAEFSAQAQALAHQSAKLSLQSAFVHHYLSLRASEAQNLVWEQMVEAQEKNIELTENRYRAGVVSQNDVLQARTQWQNARADWLAEQTRRAQYEHALAVLMGQTPAQFSIPPDPHRFAHYPLIALPSLIPSSVLLDRPDIISAERKVASANAQIGVARAAFFPLINLSGQTGYKGTRFSSLIETPSGYWSWGPALSWTLWDFGAKSANLDAAWANYQVAVANYRQVALSAFLEVEDNLIAAHHLAQQSAIIDDTQSAVDKILTITKNQYKAGTVGYLNVLTAQNNQQNAQLKAINSKLQYLTAMAVLLKNTAGKIEEAPAQTNERRIE